MAQTPTRLLDHALCQGLLLPSSLVETEMMKAFFWTALAHPQHLGKVEQRLKPLERVGGSGEPETRSGKIGQSWHASPLDLCHFS